MRLRGPTSLILKTYPQYLVMSQRGEQEARTSPSKRSVSVCFRSRSSRCLQAPANGPRAHRGTPVTSGSTRITLTDSGTAARAPPLPMSLSSRSAAREALGPHAGDSASCGCVAGLLWRRSQRAGSAWPVASLLALLPDGLRLLPVARVGVSASRDPRQGLRQVPANPTIGSHTRDLPASKSPLARDPALGVSRRSWRGAGPDQEWSVPGQSSSSSGNTGWYRPRPEGSFPDLLCVPGGDWTPRSSGSSHATMDSSPIEQLTRREIHPRARQEGGFRPIASCVSGTG